MNPLILRLLLIATLSAMAPLPARAELADLQQSWSEIMYATAKDGRSAALGRLAERARREAEEHPDDAGVLIWKGIILSTWGGEKGGLGALGLVKEARAALERALEIDPTALMGSAYTTLGSLYYKVPGWPIGFGSASKARQNLQRALEINPDGIDPNFFMGEFLIDQGDRAGARPYLEKALQAPARPGRELADRGRREEVRNLLAQLDAT